MTCCWFSNLFLCTSSTLSAELGTFCWVYWLCRIVGLCTLEKAYMESFTYIMSICPARRVKSKSVIKLGSLCEWMNDFEKWWMFVFVQACLAIIRPCVKVVEYLCKWLKREEVGVDPLFRTPLPAFSDQCNAHWVPRQTLKIPLTVVKGGARVVIRCLQLVSALACGWVEPSSIGQPHLNPTQGCQSRLRWWWRKYIF